MIHTADSEITADADGWPKDDRPGNSPTVLKPIPLRVVLLTFGGLLLVLSGCGRTEVPAKAGLTATELKRWHVRGATQGVAVGGKWFYVIDNARIARHEKETGRLLNEWTGRSGSTIQHLNAGVVQDGYLMCSHSNCPELPMTNSLEVFNLVTLQPEKSVSISGEHGSLVWAERKDGFWWACFANYDRYGGAPGRDHRDTLFTKLDDEFRLVALWRFPPQVLAAFKPWSCSGGSWGDDGLLYVTGHDAKELYVLRLPKSGAVLEQVMTIGIPFEGQAWAWDRSQTRVLYAIRRSKSEVLMVQLPETPAELMKR